MSKTSWQFPNLRGGAVIGMKATRQCQVALVDHHNYILWKAGQPFRAVDGGVHKFQEFTLRAPVAGTYYVVMDAQPGTQHSIPRVIA